MRSRVAFKEQARRLASPTRIPLTVALQDLLDYRLDRKRRRIEHLRIRRRNQWSDGAIRVARIPLLQITGKGAQISTDSFFYQLLIAPLGPHFRARCQEDFERRVGEHHGSHVAAIG